MVILLVCAVFAPLLAPHDPTKVSPLDAKLAPGDDWTYPLGTDVVGQDILSRLIFGARTVLIIGLISLATGAFVGTVLGMVAGYRGGWVDALIMRVADAAMGFPTILLAMIIVTILGAGMENIITGGGPNGLGQVLPDDPGEVLSLREQEFVTLAKIAGVSTPMIIARHIFPNVVNTLMVLSSLQIGQVILLEAALSFLGLGLPAGDPAWGIMVAEGRAVVVSVWWLALFPGLAITVVVLAFNFFGDWLRDALDPKLRRA